MSNEEPQEEWIKRARKGKTRAQRVQCYLQKDDYEWFDNFRRERGLSESAAVRLCLRHVKNEHGMKERGRKSALMQEEIDIDSMLNLRGKNDGTDEA